MIRGLSSWAQFLRPDGIILNIEERSEIAKGV